MGLTIYSVTATVISTLISLFAIQYHKIKNQKKLLALIPKTWKLILTSISMMIINMIICLTLINVYNESSLIYIIKRILMLSIIWIAAYYDWTSQRIPNKLILAGLGARVIILVFELFLETDTVFNTVISDLIAGASIFIISMLCILVARNSLGMGDIKLFMLMGFYLGVRGMISCVFVSLLVSFAVSVVLLITKKKKRKDTIPFAPSILIGTALAIFLLGG